MQLKSREEIANALVEVLMTKPEANVMILVDGPSGVEIVATQQSLIWALGLLDIASTMLDETVRSAITPFVPEGKGVMMQAMEVKEGIKH